MWTLTMWNPIPKSCVNQVVNDERVQTKINVCFFRTWQTLLMLRKNMEQRNYLVHVNVKININVNVSVPLKA